MRRTVEEIKRLSHSKDNCGCIHHPLFDIPLPNVIPDELHLLLRITDKLLQNVIDEVLERDSVEDFDKPRGQTKGAHLKNLVQAINDLGISFSVWNKRNPDGSESQVNEFTSLLGTQKKKLLSELPSRLHTFLYPDTCETVKKIWDDFGSLYSMIADFNLTTDASRDIFDKAKAWIDLFCSLRGARPGYTRPRVTPYMHLIPYHLPFFVQRHGCPKKFTGQGVEKNNDDAKRIFFQNSNKWDAAKDILLTESRQWDLRHHEREKGTYVKRKLEYWGHGISEIRMKKRSESKISTPNEDEDMLDLNSKDDLYKLTIKQLKDVVREKGLNTKGLYKLKKQELIHLIENAYDKK